MHWESEGARLQRSMLMGSGVSLQVIEQRVDPPPSSTSTKPLAPVVADVQSTLKRIQSQNQDEAFCALGKLGEPALR